ncbi:helix-turn-helix domain-containing protein [Ursidibacter arcticus]
MQIHDKIRMIREQNKFSQEDIAEKINMSPSGYAKIERGETKLYIDKLEKIAQIFNMDIIDLINNDKNFCVLINENSQSSSNYYNSDDALIIENEKLKISLAFQEKLITQLNNEIQLLKEMNLLLKSKTAE